jgi:hypothetical protein
MIANHIHHALAQVRELRHKIIEKQRFKGYSGRARALGGTVALMAAIIMASDWFPTRNLYHVIGWGMVFAIAVGLNYGALVYWFLFDPSVERDIRKLRPVLDIMPPILFGGVLTLAFLVHGEHRLLFGMWMGLFGLANLASYHVLPREIIVVGLFYFTAGTICLLKPGLQFNNPWPMGTVFFFGEWLGGVILHFDGLPPSLSTLLGIHLEETHED